jgi:hypothetical protein
MLGKILETPIGPAVMISDSHCVLVSEEPQVFNGILTPLENWWIIPKAFVISNPRDYSEIATVDVKAFSESFYCALILHHTLEKL